jgi:hypothetical protein
MLSNAAFIEGAVVLFAAAPLRPKYQRSQGEEILEVQFSEILANTDALCRSRA